jgi:hypothetical protein
MSNTESERNRALARSIFEVGLNQGDVEAIVRQTADDFIDHDIHVETGIPGGPEDMRQALHAIRRGFPDIHVTVEQTLAEGDWVVTRNTWRGTHQGVFNGIPPTGNRVEITGIVLWRIVDGKIKERRGTIDTFTLLRQLNVLPGGGAEGSDVAKLHDAYVEAWKRNDTEAAMSFWSDDIVMYAPGANPHTGVYRGKSEVRKNLIDRIFAETTKAEVLGISDRAVGKELVFTVVHERFEKADGRRFETHRIVIYRWSNEKIIEVRYFDPDQRAADAFWAK